MTIADADVDSPERDSNMMPLSRDFFVIATLSLVAAFRTPF